MRIRPLAALSTVALATVLLAGCAGGGTGSGTPSPTDTPAADLCGAAAPTGPTAEAITVTGEVGSPAEVEFAAPLEILSSERVVTVEGDGDPITNGDLVSYAVTIFDASTGEAVQSEGYESTILPVPVTVGSGADAFFGCATPGSRIVMALAGSETSPAAVWVLDVLGTTPTAAWGEDQPAVDGMPTVELGEDGAPTITLPEGDAPTEVELAVLKQGDGPVVESGDQVMVQYTGVKWSDGTVFDSSWESGAPASFATTGVVAGFQQALEGQTVGSQVLVVIPPAAGYGASEGHELQNETIVFVVDILAAQHAPAA